MTEVAIAKLEPWLLAGDPIAEAVLPELRRRPRAFAHPLPAIRELAASSVACASFLESTYAVPAWADFEAMRAGGAMAARLFPQFALATSHCALFLTFASPDSARILARTGRFERSVPRRLAESAPLFFRVIETDALRPGGEVWEIALQIRLLHAMVRQKLLLSSEWRDAGSVPINQLHTATGPLFFGTYFVDAMRALGARITSEEAESYRLIWRYVTWILGVPHDLLGRTDAEQTAINDALASVGFAPDDTSRRLAQACLEGLGLVPEMAAIPAPIHAALVERALGRDLSERMGIGARPWSRAVATSFAALLSLYGLLQRVPFARGICERIGRRVLAASVERGLTGLRGDAPVLEQHVG